MNKQYREVEGSFPALRPELFVLMRCVGLPDLTSAAAVDEFVLRAQAYEVVEGTTNGTGPLRETELRAAAGARIDAPAKSRAVFKAELGDAALKRLGLHL